MGRVSTIAENLNSVRNRIAAAAAKSGRREEEIRLIAVSKTQPIEAIREALAAGARELGENYVQEAEEKLAGLEPGTAIRHFIGHLQKNKAGKAAALFEMVQCVDDLELAQALGRRAELLGKRLDVLLEVNISGEVSKFGVSPERTLALAEAVAPISGVRLCGLMGIGPLQGDERAVRESFRRLRGLFEQLPAEHRLVLSMGMTGDFEAAIEEGSTMVRIGTGIFGPRQKRD